MPRPLSIVEMFFKTHNLLHRKIFRKSVKVSDPSRKSVELSCLTFKVKNCFKNWNKFNLKGMRSVSFMNFRVPDLKKGDVMNAQGGQIVSILAIWFLYANVFTRFFNTFSDDHLSWNDGIKGQLISKRLWYPEFFQKMNEKIRLNYYNTSGRIVFARFLKELTSPKKTFWN